MVPGEALGPIGIFTFLWLIRGRVAVTENVGFGGQTAGAESRFCLFLAGTWGAAALCLGVVFLSEDNSSLSLGVFLSEPCCQTRTSLALTRLYNVPSQGNPWGLHLKSPALGSLSAPLGPTLPVWPQHRGPFDWTLERPMRLGLRHRGQMPPTLPVPRRKSLDSLPEQVDLNLDSEDWAHSPMPWFHPQGQTGSIHLP